ncbi:MAG TPA: hypothetical protein PKW95_12085 [bacterium]|nr:hypothetical protein [bacterium]
MKKLIVTIVILSFIGIIAFAGYRFLAIHTKDAVVDPQTYLGNRGNPASIYAAASTGVVYSPLNVDIVSMNSLMLIDVADDPEYLTIELQTFDDSRGQGARVLLYHHQGPADSYYTDKAFEIRESENSQSIIDPDIQYHFAVTATGLNASLSMHDRNGKPIEFRVNETRRKKWSRGFLAPIGAGDAVTFDYFPFLHMKNMNFVLRSGTEISVKIDGQKRTPKKLPVPVDGELVYLTRYTAAPIIACWNRPHQGVLPPLTPQQSTIEDGQTRYELVDNAGHYEIKKMVGFNDRHSVTFEFSPPLPDTVALKEEVVVDGRFCAGADDVAGIVAGTYRLARRGNVIDLEISPQEGWQPIPGKSWVKKWRWQGSVTVAPDNAVTMDSAWIRVQ